jgi:hypothetical protein
MERTFIKQVSQAGIALAALVALFALGIGTARAAPTFATADITVNSVGFLECAFKETGLAPGSTVDYICGATDVGWVTQCFVRNKPVSNLPIKVHVAHAADGLVTTQDRTASNKGTVTSSILTAYPTVEEEVGAPLCPESEGVEITEEITAIRWCNASLADATNGVAGATVAELFLQLKRNGSAAVPSCAELAALPTDI